MVIGRKNKYTKHHRRYKNESINENGGDPPPTNTQPPLTHAATTSNIYATSTITASITNTVIVIHCMPTITFAVDVPSSVASSVVTTYDKKNEKG
jgi:hypothetical protein